MKRTFLDDNELGELQALHAQAQAKAQEARLAQLMVDTYIRLAAATRGLDPQGRYAVSPRGELLPLPTENQAPSVEGQIPEELILDREPTV
ncbi:MAG: hypothetical protein Q8P59_03375 [Dehalococcoidia bacterium]|nr:hypothetical protein [Dehalococcoidia bacterium]